MTVSADQVGKLYDILIATRDGSTLPCVDLRGQSQNVSQVAYMLSTTKPSTEATELDRMRQLISTSSAQMTDRDLDAYPQVEQGDWTDGMGQRVFSGQGEALGTISNKSTAYWDGLGVLWPLRDYLPQRPVHANPDQAEAAAMKTAGNGVTAGFYQTGFAATVPSYAYAYMRISDGHNILAVQTPSALRKIDPIPNSVNGTPLTTSVDYVFAHGALWLAVLNNAGTAVVVNGYQDANPPLVVYTTSITASGNPGVTVTKIAAGRVGDSPYLAVLYTAVSLRQTINIYRVTDFTALSGSVASVPVSDVNGATFIKQMDFQGDNLIVAGVTGLQAFLLQFNIPSQTWSTLATWSGANNIYFCPIAGGLFCLVTQDVASNNFGNQVDMWLVMGASAQHLGPVIVQGTTQAASNVIQGETEPVALGPYAIFGVCYSPPPGGVNSRVSVMAYDVLRGRLFKVDDIGSYDPTLLFQSGTTLAPRRTAVSIPASRPAPGGTLFCQWMVGVPVLSGAGSAFDVTNVQNLMIGVSTGGFQPLLQQGVQITSSLIDFTSGQNKLYRQLVADFTPLPADSAVTVQLDCWFDQDPANLSAVPDFTTGVVASGVNGGVTGQRQLKLITNRIARKVVYRITTVGPSATFTPAVKLISVKVQVATGWTLHYFIDIGPRTLANDGSDAYRNQAPVDTSVAHNFLKQLWRFKGGECVVTLPDGSNYNALLQLISAETLKFRNPAGDSPGQLQFQAIVELKIREDV